MSSRIQLTLSAATLLLAVVVCSHFASAQVVAYDHRSTVLGDHLAGASELVRAQGSFLRDEAAAAETWVRVAAAQDELQYRRASYRFSVKQMEQEHIQRKAASNRERQKAAAAADLAAAIRLYESARRGGTEWPTALSQPKYASSLAMVKSLLRNWSPNDPTSDAYRAALATEVGVLKVRVTADQSLEFTSRVEAVRALSQLQQLARMPASELPSGGSNGPQLAMK